jgi:hypothetical protein
MALMCVLRWLEYYFRTDGDAYLREWPKDKGLEGEQEGTQDQGLTNIANPAPALHNYILDS